METPIEYEKLSIIFSSRKIAPKSFSKLSGAPSGMQVRVQFFSHFVVCFIDTNPKTSESVLLCSQSNQQTITTPQLQTETVVAGKSGYFIFLNFILQIRRAVAHQLHHVSSTKPATIAVSIASMRNHDVIVVFRHHHTIECICHQ